MINIREFINLETLAGNCLFGATLLALYLSNSSWSHVYSTVFTAPISIYHLTTHLKFVINDVLMAIFFLVVGLEIKYELLQGALNSYQKALLPVIAAIGGMIVPAIIYMAFNYNNKLNLRGWAIPTATDIAFALGVLSLLGSRVVPSLKAFLTALAIIDDLLAIIIIAFFYTPTVSLLYLGLSFVCLMALLILNFRSVNHLAPYCLLGGLLWCCMLFAGVHPTLAGVMLAFTIPLESKKHQTPPLHRLSNILHPLVAFAVLPLFAFANAGISFTELSLATVKLPVFFGILVSLFLGKQLGVFATCWLAVKCRLAELPQDVRWIDLYGVAVLCGIGFTISLFVGTLAFGEDLSHIDSVKAGVFVGSLFSGIFGFLILFFTKKAD